MNKRNTIPNPLGLEDVVTVEEDRRGDITITYSDGKTVFLQTDYGKAQFAVDCGAVKAPENWDGCPSKLPDNWWEIEWDEITQIPGEYRELAE